MPVPTLPALPGSLDAHFPILLLPVSVQVKFVEPAPGTYELRVRIYPDQLGISTHEAALTPAEQQAGVQYWSLAPAADTAPGLHDLAHWRALVARFGAPRSQWILRQTVPASYRHQVPNLPMEPIPDLAEARWTRPAEARGLPHHFSVLLYTQATSLAQVAEGPVKDLLYPAPRTYDPQAVPRPTTEFLQLAKVVEGSALVNPRLAVGLDPQAAADPAGLRGVDAGNKWTVNFEEAVAKGMAVRVALTAEEYAQGFARLVVLGVRADGAAAGQQELEALLTEHYYTDGLRLVPQGTPTNNTDAVVADSPQERSDAVHMHRVEGREGTGYSSQERSDAELTFDLLTQPARFAAATPWAARPDGQHLARTLGLGDGALPPLMGALAHDTGEALTMNRALWPATYGYFLEEMLRPLLSPAAMAWTRTFFETYVLARGGAPALRVGPQPYGVLPTTRFSAWEVEADRPDHAYAAQLQQVLAQFDAAWTERLNPQTGLYPARVTAGSAAANFPAPPPAGRNVLTALGLDATSTEYYQRYLIGPIMAEALNADAQANGTSPDSPNRDQIWADAARTNGHYDATQNPLYQEFARLLDPTNAAGLQRTAAGDPVAAPPIFGYTMQSTFMKLADAFADEPGPRRGEGVLFDHEPLSETAPVAAFAGVVSAHQGHNYIHWLATASFDEIRLENFTSWVDANGGNDAFTPPRALFYYLLRQAVLLEYWAAAKVALGLPNANTPANSLADDELFNILTTNEKPRWAWLYDPAPNSTSPLYTVLRTTGSNLDRYLTEIAQLATVPTARLERLLAEHLDLGSYRLDAWRLAPVTERLDALRQTSPTGSHLGAFGWLEDLRPGDHSVANAAGDRNDPDNLGYIHAPSLTHGTTAAILRQGYKSRQSTANATDPAARRMAVDLSSRRVRAAVALLDGLRAGLSLSTLLGQSFERALQQHDGLASNGQRYGSFVEQFRTAFPLADEHASALGAGQSVPQGLPPEQAAHQVTDGVALLRAATALQTYPYGVAVPSQVADPNFAAFVVAQVTRLTDDLDALGDLAVSEGIYQAARGNTGGAAAVLESIAKGQFPLQPDIVHPPQRGLTLTQRVLVQLPAAATLANWPSSLTPRAAAAPRLNAWLAQFFPNPTQLTFGVGYRSAGEWVAPSIVSVELSAMQLQPLDLLYLLDEKALREDSSLDRLLVYATSQSMALPNPGALPPDARLAINYTIGTAEPALRRLLPLLARLRQLVGSTRPARPRDLLAPGTLVALNEEAGIDMIGLGTRLTASQTALAALVPPTNTSTLLTVAEFYRAALFGVTEALPALTPNANLSTATLVVRQAVRTRLAAADAALSSAAPAPPITVAARLEQAAALFGPAFRPDVEFALSDADARQAFDDGTTAAAATSLLRHHSDKPLALVEWLHGLGAVREPLNQLDKVLLIQSLLHPDAAPGLPLRPAQFLTVAPAANQPDYWLGLRWPDTYAPPGDALSLVQWLPDAYDALGTQCALWLDEWTETLPQATQSTALTFHYDQPNSEAPQTMLLVVSPRRNPGTWSTDDLLGAVNETLDLAKKRTVEPDALVFTPLATVLPAVVAPVAQQAVTFTLDLGRTNNTARFSEEPLTVTA
ncbi:hypothetical protein IC235_20420 [Hymenobacter sp. BT664]|uniref:Uncharacterized protein n=1 Tax=Hymenobacter montanus TaxID=2771359 RepID=A0A927GL42_9BACT|nr:hypothetical protein [Hymenobacter montanus]MBD2770258.1 hypothetical protein [Hymenobacter montanus]